MNCHEEKNTTKYQRLHIPRGNDRKLPLAPSFSWIEKQSNKYIDWFIKEKWKIKANFSKMENQKWGPGPVEEGNWNNKVWKRDFASRRALPAPFPPYENYASPNTSNTIRKQCVGERIFPRKFDDAAINQKIVNTKMLGQNFPEKFWICGKWGYMEFCSRVLPCSPYNDDGSSENREEVTTWNAPFCNLRLQNDTVSGFSIFLFYLYLKESIGP